jgi:hypothetical protein
LIGIFFGESFCALQVDWFADHFVGCANRFPERVVEALLNKTDGEVRDIDAGPAAVQALRDGDRCAAAAEGIEDGVTFVSACGEDTI